MPDTGLWRGSVAQRLRLVSGLVLLVFSGFHYVGHALGLVSLGAMEGFDAGFTAVTWSLPGTVVLAGALLVHGALAFWLVLRQRGWAMPVWQWLQLGLGLLIPLQLLPHILSARVGAEVFGIDTSYTYELARIWPATILPQGLLLFAVWVHGCIGLHMWLRLWAPYRRVQPVLFAAAVLLPCAALAGVSVQGRAVEAAMADPAGAAAIRAATRWPDEPASAALHRWDLQLRTAYLVLLGLAALVALVLTLMSFGRRRIPVRYGAGRTVYTERGPSLLDVSRRHGIPHLSVCGGRGRCSTCRVLVLEHPGHLSPPEEDERRTLRSIGAPPQVRLACQARPLAAVTVLPMLAAAPAAADPLAPAAVAASGIERDLAVLFVDLRGFTALTERKLPFDVVYILNRFFAAVRAPIEAYGGWIANYAGDGAIALFAHDEGQPAACAAAARAAAAIDGALEALNQHLAAELRQPLRIAMGLHAGPHVMGRVGEGTAQQAMAAVGLAINVASRLEALAKQENVQLAMSGTVADQGGVDRTGLRAAAIDVRGLSAPLDVVFVEAARGLLPRMAREAPADA